MECTYDSVTASGLHPSDIFKNRHDHHAPGQAFVYDALFFPRTFLIGVTRTVLLVSLQAWGTKLTIYTAAPGCARAKSKPVSLGGGWEFGVARWAGVFCEDLAGGTGVAFKVVAPAC